MILFVDGLTVIDFSYFCDKRGAVGESWIVDLTLHGDLNQESMVLDFSLVKKQVKKIIDEILDHKLAIPVDNNAVTLAKSADKVVIECQFGDSQRLAMSAPVEACALLGTEKIDIESATRFLVEQITPHMPDNVSKVELTLKPEHADSFYYHYSHGLKKHDGNCQRIVHGHRSKIGIFIDDMTMPRLQKQWAERWCDIYLGSEEDIIAAGKLIDIEGRDDEYCFAYNASQGYFELAISRSVCEILPCDTTVECIADFIAGEIKAEYQDSKVKVVAYEGVGKGSVSYA